MRVLAAVMVTLVAMQPVFADIAGLPVWITITDDIPDAATLAEAGVVAVALPPALVNEANTAQMREAGLKVLGLLALEDAPAEVAEMPTLDGLLVASLPNGEFEGRPAWDVECGGAAEGSLEHLLAVKRSGDRWLTFFEELANATDPPVYLAMLEGDAFPESAQWRYLDRHALLSDGLIDGVLLRAEAPDLRRPRLSTPGEVVAGIAPTAAPAAAAMTVLRSRDADVLLAPTVDDPVAWMETLSNTLSGLQRAEQDREEFARAVEAGELSIVAGTEPEGDLDVATVHGVGQSFSLEATVSVVGVGLHCMLRGPNALGLDDLQIAIRPDAEDAPDMETVLAEGTIPAAAYAEPGFQWGYARFEEPVLLEAGTTYWIHAPDVQDSGNSYVWQITRDGEACPTGHAWSGRYDYVEHDWIFRVLAEGDEAQ